MKIALLSIGDEVLIGQTLDRNVHYMAHALFQKGYKVFTQQTCGDDLNVLVDTLKRLYASHDLVITTGGLGPTTDDITKEAIAKSLEIPLQKNTDVAHRLEQQWGPHLASLEEQSTVPVGAQILDNAIGTAPGFILTKNDRHAVFLPGVPAELHAQFQNFVLPFVLKQFPITTPWRSREISFCLASENAIFALYEPLEKAHPHIQFGIYPRFSHIKIVMRAQNEDAKAFQTETQKIIEAFAKAFPHSLYTTEAQSIEEVLIALFQKQHIRLALAESCTGGQIAARLVKVPGASECLDASLVTYSNKAKETLLKVPKDTLQTHGAVSAQTAQAMVEGALKVTHADWALSITGIAGPQGGTEKKPIGTVYMAISSQKGPIIVQKVPLTHNLDREYYIESCSTFALYALWQQVHFGALDLSLLQ